MGFRQFFSFPNLESIKELITNLFTCTSNAAEESNPRVDDAKYYGGGGGGWHGGGGHGGGGWHGGGGRGGGGRCCTGKEAQKEKAAKP